MGFPSAARGRAVVSCVLADGTRSTPKLIESFDLKTSADAVVDQLEDLAKALSSKIAGLSLDGAVVRTADFAPVASRRAAAAQRLLIEGALLLVCRSRLANVNARNGKEVGEALAIAKKDVIARGRSLDARRPDAVAAALSALPDN